MSVPRKKPGYRPMFGREADSVWGYTFGLSGFMTVDETKWWLGLNEQELQNLTMCRQVRKGGVDGEINYCRQSVIDYAMPLEQYI